MSIEIEPVGYTPLATNEPSRPLRRYQDISDEVLDGPWAKKAVLTFDRGGVRGYSSLLVLKALMLKIKEIETEDSNSRICSSRDYPWMGARASSISTSDEATLGDFLPCHYFDYIAGTSTGGLSAIMLWRLRMPVDEALRQYKMFGDNVFGKARWWHARSGLWFPRAKYPSKKARNAFKQIIHDKITEHDETLPYYQAEMELFKYRKDRTRTIVFSFSVDKKEGIDMGYLWRTYSHESRINASNDTYRPMNPSFAHTIPIWQVARATSAAPSYFEPIKIGDKEHFDGGVFANNPSLRVLEEVRALHGYSPRIFISIGCGLKTKANENKPRGNSQLQTFNDQIVDSGRRKREALKKWFELFHGVRRFMTDTEGPNGVQGWSNECITLQIKYRWRLNVEGELTQVALDDWDPPKSGKTTLDKIEKETNDYLSQDTIKEEILEMARELVKIRHERAETERWERFALDVAYRCPESSCQGQHSRGIILLQYKAHMGLRVQDRTRILTK
ncbi:FabD/lysophospholipase-like protein [Daldinia grandis]|nr:FabD/lysophospholipase-like protein [Daldinia grandis]